MNKISSSDCISHQHGYANTEQATICIKLQQFLQTPHSYFSMNIKESSWIPKLVKLMKIEGNKTLKNVCIQWISMLSPTRMVLEQYCILLMEMALDSPIKTKAITNLQILVDVEVTLGWSYFFSLVYYFIKFNKLWHVFMCNFVATMKICQRELYAIYLTLLLLLGPFFSINSIL
jgi:hypothetical protein